MPIEMSDRVILITEKSRITSPIKIALNSLALEIEAEYPALTSISVMRTGIARSGKTAFIRTELLRFIRDKGFPRAIILDSQIDLGRECPPDPDMLKIFKTFLIAYVILSKGAELKKLRGNFILLAKGNAFEKQFGIGADPLCVMNLLSTQNPEINIFIDELKNNPQLFNELFSITVLDTDLSSDVITETVKKSLTGTKQNTPAEKQTQPAAASPAEIKKKIEKTPENDADARIVFRIDSDSVYDNGRIITELTEEHRSLKEREFYIIGAWVSKNELDISKQIATVLQKGISEKARFGYSDAIKFNIDDRCMIDKNTTLSIAQLFTKNLSLFKKITISASVKNSELIQKSRGFPMIRDIFTAETEPGQ